MRAAGDDLSRYLSTVSLRILNGPISSNLASDPRDDDAGAAIRHVSWKTPCLSSSGLRKSPMRKIIERFVTLPFAGKLGARCHLSYLDGELEASLFFSYDGQEVPSIASKLTYDHIKTFVTEQGILARNLVEERQIVDELFQDFVFNPQTATYHAKTEKKIVEFMTGVIPAQPAPGPVRMSAKSARPIHLR